MHNLVFSKDQVANLPVYLSYYLFPFVSLFALMTGRGLVNYDIVWVMLYGVVFLYSAELRFPRRHLWFLLSLGGLILYKYVLPMAWTSPVWYRPLIMDCKWVMYLLLAFLWVDVIGYPRPAVFYRAARFFCFFYIACAVMQLAATGDFRLSLLSEANYDCFLFLIPFCLIENVPHRRSDYILFFIATLLSGSRTGIMAFLALCFLITSRYKPRLTLLLGGASVLIVLALFQLRGSTDITKIDRFLFFLQAIEFFRENDISTFLFGTYPGSPMNLTPLPGFGFYIDWFEQSNGIEGCYAFYFHSTYLRLAVTWGVPLVVLLFGSFVVKFFRTKYLPLKLYICLILMEAVSLSSMTLTTVSFILFLAGFTIFRYEKLPDRTGAALNC